MQHSINVRSQHQHSIQIYKIIDTSQVMSSKIILRPAQRSDISDLALLGNAANANSVLHRRIAPSQDQSPVGHYQWRRNLVRLRFPAPDIRTIVAVNSSSGELLGQATWAIEGSDTALYKKWTGESTWADWLENKLISIERTWSRYFSDEFIDYRFLDQFLAAFTGNQRAQRPACLHCHLIVVKPDIQSKGVGRMLIDWGKELAVKEELPLFLESNLEATGFYDKIGFSRMNKDVVVSPDGQDSICIPAYVWEGKEREGRWLERDMEFDGEGERWKWKDAVLPK
ncbi:Hypothetical protein R9X50_00056000 [Acrodontium crateriforme]|uniref:N-acetyltransferase domain-containing protein n=1 Tax=Acrodontium crateriforme TaxID=150365 RepID=A0AAQ3R789_9PEZI|nr:Hypothetical protein R9X50_00056000 [Acrodontium crateriforme]